MSDKLIWPDCKHCKQVNDLWDENNKLKKAYDEVCAERDKLKEGLDSFKGGNTDDV